MERLKHTIILAVAVTSVACNTEPQSCSLDPGAADPAIAQCAADEDATCVVETHPECGGETCVKWRNEAGFCTVACRDDAECGEGERCVEVVLASGQGLCVPRDYAE